MVNLSVVFLLLCFLGAALPLTQFIPWLVDYGLDLPLFFQHLFATGVSGFFALDVVVSAVVLIVFIFAEGRRLQIGKLWLPVVATLGVGVSFGFPLFLYLRQKHLESLMGNP
jgi:hypothetical protein